MARSTTTYNFSATWKDALFIYMGSYILFETAHDKNYNKTCASSEDSDQPAHPRSLIRVFADRMCLLQPPGHPKRDKQEPLPC